MTSKPSIAMFGSSLVSAYWNGAATYYRGILRALHGLGYRVRFFEPDAYDRQKHRDIEDPEWVQVLVYSATEVGVDAALESAQQSDVVIKASGVGVFDELLEEEVARLAGPSRTVAFWDVDAPATLERMHANVADPFRSHVTKYDLVLTYGGGQPVVSGYSSFGARQCVPIYNALDPSTHSPVPAEPRFAAALSFLGNRLPDREARVREFFIDAARQLPKETFLLGGNGWHEHIDLPPNVRAIGHVYTREHNAFNCSPRAVININRDSMARYGFSPPTRVFEAAGAGACLLCDAWDGIEEFLEPGSEVLVVHSGADVVSELARLTPERAHAIGDAGRERVLSQHTYAHRAAVLIDVLEGRGAPSNQQAARERVHVAAG